LKGRKGRGVRKRKENEVKGKKSGGNHTKARKGGGRESESEGKRGNFVQL